MYYGMLESGGISPPVRGGSITGLSAIVADPSRKLDFVPQYPDKLSVGWPGRRP